MNFFEEILKLLPVGVAVFDTHGRFCYANDAACRLLDIDGQKAAGTLYNLLLPDLSRGSLFPQTSSLTEVDSEKPLSHLQDGKIFLTRHSQKLFCRSLWLADNKSPEERLVLLVEDMNDNQNLAGRVLEEERLLGVMEISNTMAHKLNQYLQVIMGYVSLMALEMNQDHQCYDYLNRILEQLEQMRMTTYMLSNINCYAITERPDGRRMFDLDMAAGKQAAMNFK